MDSGLHRCRFLSFISSIEIANRCAYAGVALRAKAFSCFSRELSVIKRFLPLVCCLVLAVSVLADDLRPAAADSSRLGTDLCLDRKGRPTACPKSPPPPQTEDQKRATQKQEGEKEKTEPPSGVAPKAEERELKTAGVDLLRDQKWFWTSPLRLREENLLWFVPFAAGTAVVIGSDKTIERKLPQSTSLINRSQTFSDAGMAAFVVGSAGAYFLGRYSHNDHLRETGLLSSEAILGSLAEAEVIKGITGRERPLEDNGRGRWLQGGSSFPSIHSAVAWSSATVIASEYPGWLSKLLAYGGATAVSVTRVTGRQHFASDVLMGSALGFYNGWHVVHEHARDSAEPDRRGVTFEKTPAEPPPLEPEAKRAFEAGLTPFSDDPNLEYTKASSSYISLDSWVYPAMERLYSMGYLDTAYLGLRPWTRIACARMLAKSEEKITNSGSPAAKQLLTALRQEFSDDVVALDSRAHARLESVYARALDIAGPPLNDSSHFGQTLINDYGRPYQQGFNNVDGFSGYAGAGAFSLQVRGEYQYAPGSAAYPLSVREAIAQMDQNPVLPPQPISQTNTFRLIDANVSMHLANHEISVGKAEDWWGPGQGGSMAWSNNAEPIYALRINRVEPLSIPLLSRLIGPVRYDAFLGDLKGHGYPNAPWVHAEKFSFKPTPNLEFGFSRVVVFAGEGHVPLTLGSFWNSFESFTDVSSAQKLSRNDPGARHSAFDFTYRLPWLRNWVTLYTDSIVHDDASPIDAPRRAAFNPGIYISHFPKLSRLDFRAEAVSTDAPAIEPFQCCGNFYYYEAVYHNFYTNQGNMLGSWIGRDAKGGQAWLTYWLSPKESLQLGYRNVKASQQFVHGGTTQNDFSVRAVERLKRQLELTAFAQLEYWKAPLLATGLQRDFTTALQLTYFPSVSWRKH